ncbi:MAG: hypothetical protein R2749_25950 [Acidimicrobiales bacterium]
MPERFSPSLPGPLTRRMLLGRSLGMLAGVFLVGCGPRNAPDESSRASDGTAARLQGARVHVWRDPG